MVVAEVKTQHKTVNVPSARLFYARILFFCREGGGYIEEAHVILCTF
nr:MAG TPA: hypothetical protein [Caudoviricetes sp.]